MKTLNEIIVNYQGLESQIIENEGVLDDLLEARLTENSEELAAKMDGYAGFIAYLKGQVEYLKSEAEAYTSRAKTLTNSIEGMRERMLYAMQATGNDKLKTEKHSYSLRSTESWKINDDLFDNADLDKLVSEGMAERTYKVDMKALKDALKNAEELPEYVDVLKKQSLTIR